MSANRYQDLFSFVPAGGFYAQDGIVIPYRDSPYPLRFVTGAPNSVWGVFLNSRFQGTITTDANGLATVTVLLDGGTNDILLQQEGTGQSVQSTVSATNFATWMAAEADQLQLIDTQQEEMLNDARLASCAPDMLSPVWGVTVNAKNVATYSSDTYREMIQEMRQAFRPFGGTRRGLDNIVSSVTQIRPLLFKRDQLGPRWILGANFIENSDLQEWPMELDTNTLPNIDSGHPGNATAVLLDGTSHGVMPLGSGSLSCRGLLTGLGTVPSMRWIAPDSATSSFVQVNNGPNTLVATKGTNAVIKSKNSVGGTISFEGATNILLVGMDGHGPVAVSLAFSSSTPATIATAINNAFNGDPRYGVGYNAVASVETLTSGDQRIVLTTPTAPPSGYITFWPVASGASGASGLFDIPYNHSLLANTGSPGATTITLNSTTFNRLPWLTGSDHFQQFKIRLRDPASSSTEIHTVLAADSVAHTLSLDSGLIATYGVNTVVELVGSWPVRIDGAINTYSLQVTVIDSSLLPRSIFSTSTDTLVFGGSNCPTEWIINTGTTPNAPSNFDGPPDLANPPASIASIEPGYLAQSVLRITTTGGHVPVQIAKRVNQRILNYKGFQVDFDVWMATETESVSTASVFIEMSFDGGATWTGGDNGQDFSLPPGKLDWYRPHRFNRKFTIATNATDVWVRILVFDSAFRIERFHLQQSSDTALWLGYNTIPRSEQRSKQGYFSYVWSPNQLTRDEDALLGVPTGTVGKIDDVLPAHMYLERFDVSEYDNTTSKPLNIFGVFDEVDFANSTVVNMGLQIRTPSRFTYLLPTTVSEQTTNITSWDNTYKVTLPTQSDQSYKTSILFENGIPLATDSWQYVDSAHIQFINSYIPNATFTYTFQFQALMQLQTPVLDLGANWANYLWYPDWHLYQRADLQETGHTSTIQADFDANGNFSLPRPTDQDQTTSSLVQDSGINKTTVPLSQWSFPNSNTISINTTAFDPNSIYTLTYQAQAIYPGDFVGVLVEARTGTSSGAAAAATYQAVDNNTPLASQNRYVQLRITISNVLDTRDARLYSLLVKGLDLYGSDIVPVLSGGSL